MTITLHEWQQDAMNRLKSTLRGGIVEAATGSGKTVLGLKLIEENPDKKVLVVVPTIALQDQWFKEITSKFALLKPKDVSLIGGGHKDMPGCHVTIAVVDSLRTVNWKHPTAAFNIVILDEVHRYASPMNINFLKEGSFDFIVGLTGTLQRADGLERLLHQYVGQTVYEMDNRDAIDAGYVSEYDVSLSPCCMTANEASRYLSIDNTVHRYMQIFNNDYSKARDIVRSGARHQMYQYAIKLMMTVQERKQFINRVESKHDVAISLVQQHPNDKIILFDEIQTSANKIYEDLRALGINCVLYHSKIKTKEKREAIVKFKNGESNVLVTVRALDEGLDVKEADVGIIVNGNSQRRQTLQRLGRLLRKKEGKTALLYMLFVPGTQDAKYIQKRMEYLSPSVKDVATDWDQTTLDDGGDGVADGN